MWLIAVIFLGLSALVALGNVVGTLHAYIDHARGGKTNYSQVALLSLLFAGVSWYFSPDSWGLWVFILPALDPGTWVLVAVPWVIWDCYHSKPGDDVAATT